MPRKPSPGFVTLADVLTEQTLRRLAWGASFSRGRWYLKDGAVRELTELDDGIYARVRGTRLYHVRLWAAPEGLGYECSCPIGRDGFFCKHCVAAGLAWLSPLAPGMPGHEGDTDRTLDAADRFVHSVNGTKALKVIEPTIERLVQAALHSRRAGCEVRGQLERACALHLEACRASRPDPKQLARRLLDWTLAGLWGRFADPLDQYGDILGPTGLAEYRRSAQELFERLCAPTRRRRTDPTGVLFAITMVMESLARRSGDIDELVRVRATDLSTPARYLGIARLYLEAGRRKECIEWAEKGVKAFGRRRDTELHQFLEEQYLASGRSNDALSLVWSAYSIDPRPEQYARLKALATKLKQWAVWREEALELLRERAATEQKRMRDGDMSFRYSPSANALVELLLSEGDTDAAWHEAQGATLWEGTWLRLAQAREKTHPADAISVYQRLIPAYLDGPYVRRYELVQQMMLKICRLMEQMGRTEQFHRYLEDLIARNRRRRNLIALLTAVAWP